MITNSHPSHDDRTTPPLWLALVAAASAGGMGWGIRGQYGHETGAMLAGVLVGLVLVHLFCPLATSLTAARAVALCALGISLGGSMTYGQTVGLTHDAELIGNWEALRWGLLGLSLKGGIWIAFAGVMLGMGLGDRQYRPLELAVLLVVMLACLFLGVYLLNMPFDPAARELPKIYFSDDWYWEPGADLEPRRERWGGLLMALVALVAYVGGVRKDRLALRLAAWGFLGGAIGFPGGQCLQAYHAWNVESFRQGWFATLEPHMNWWNVMEITFGAVFGAVLALGLWLNRRLVAAEEKVATSVFNEPVEWLLVAVHLVALVTWNFAEVPLLDLVADHALTMIAIPLVAVMGGRLWPYLVTLPIVALPVAGKTVRQLCYEETAVSPIAGYAFYLVLPLVVATATALLLARQPDSRPSSRTFSRWALLVTTWLYFGLNFAFFHYPWPWQAWTGRTPSGIVFAVCSVILTSIALYTGPEPAAKSQPPELAV
ncbi:MAG: hypothetical protein WD738_00850 [Pirellulales bacterium]